MEYVMNAFEGDIRDKIVGLETEKKQMKKEILELRDAFDTMKLLAIPKAYTDGDYLSTTVLKICEEALKDTEKYVKEGEK
jgi:hypothetical protein